MMELGIVVSGECWASEWCVLPIRQTWQNVISAGDVDPREDSFGLFILIVVLDNFETAPLLMFLQCSEILEVVHDAEMYRREGITAVQRLHCFEVLISKSFLFPQIAKGHTGTLKLLVNFIVNAYICSGSCDRGWGLLTFSRVSSYIFPSV